MTVATGAAAAGGFAGIESLLIGRSEAIVRVRNLVMRLAGSQASVLVTGPSGTGKEVVARCLHQASSRKDNEFVAVNCGAIPRELIESELFGHEKGAFTGALQSRKGRFEAADRGTIFLDEIGDMPADMQVKLLRVLEERQIERVGSNKTMAVDVRVVSATHKNLEQAIAEGRFREDLFYRLNIFPLHLPALAERREDIPLLITHFLKQAGAKLRFAASALRVLCQHDWPGNIRELRNVVERAMVLFGDAEIGAEDAGILLGSAPGRGEPAKEDIALWDATTLDIDEADIPLRASPELAHSAVSLRDPDHMPLDTMALLGSGRCDLRAVVAKLEQSLIHAALEQSGEIVADAARALGLQRTSLIEKMRKYGISRGERIAA